MKLPIIKTMEEIAKKKPVRVLVCEGWDERCLKASAQIMEEKLAKIVLLGDPAIIKKKAKELKVDISNAEIVDYKKSQVKKELAEKLYQLRKEKGLTLEQATKLIEDENYFGCMYVHAGYADAVVGSAICPTAALMRPALQLLRQKGKTVSEVGVVSDVKNKRILFVSDLSLNINPNSEELAQIALNAASCVRMFKIVPRVALLSYSTKGSGGDGEDILLIRKALEIVKSKDPTLIIDGEMQLDAAVSPASAVRKCPDSVLKGDANTLIFPNLVCGNIFVHGMMQFSDMGFEFTMLEGMAKPVSILGRSTPLQTVKNLFASVAIFLVLYGCTRLFRHLHAAFADIFNFKIEGETAVERVVKREVWSLVYLVLLLVLVFVFIIFNIAVNLSSVFFVHLVPAEAAAFYLVVGNYAVTYLGTLVLFVIIYRFSSERRVSWRSAWWGGALGAFLFTLANTLFGFYVSFSAVIPLYGAASFLVALVLWTYYGALVLLLGAEVAKMAECRYPRHRQKVCL